VRIDEPGKVAALDAGTDDWTAKPFGEEEERLTGGSPPDLSPRRPRGFCISGGFGDK
jgi:hypothetical protein